MITTIIGISGKKLSGKDTLCELIQKHADVKSCRVAFADAVKEEVAKACNVTVCKVNTNKERFRPILQWWGTDFRRYYHGDNYWIIKAFLTITEHVRQGAELVIIPDVRFLSEVEALREAKAHLIRISRPITSTDTHASETELDSYTDFDEIVLNKGLIFDLENEAKDILRKLKLPIK